MQPKVPASVSSVAIASLAMSSVAGSLTSSHAPVGVVSSFTPVGGVLSSMLWVRESRSAAELERMHTGPGALPCAANLVQCAYAGATRSHDDDETTVCGGDSSSVSSDESIELTPQATVRDSVTGRSGPPAMATSSYYDLLLAATGPSMTVTSQWIDQQRERTPPVRSAFSAIGERTVSPNSLRCDEEVARLSEAAASQPRPRTSSAPDSPSRCDVNVPLGGTRHRSPPPAFSAWPHALSHTSSRAQSRAPSQMWRAYSTAWSTGSTTTYSKSEPKPINGNKWPELKLHSKKSEPTSANSRQGPKLISVNVRLELRPKRKQFSANKQSKLKPDSANKRLKRKPEQRQRLKHFSEKSKSAVKWRRRWRSTACVESWLRKKPKNASRS